jgi:hypothetical protein
VQGRLLLQARNVPELQTLLPSHVSPSTALVFVSWQTATPVEQEVVPLWHGFDDGVQSAPTTQLLHTPALQTLSTPQAVPSVTLLAATQTG